MRDLAFSVLIAVVLIVFIYQPVKVEGTSMMPALTDQERIFINKFTYRFGIGSIDRGDMVVFWYPLDPSKSYIKRVIGLPGDRVEIDRGTVFVNGKRLDEDYVPEDYRDDQSCLPPWCPPGQLLRPGRPPQFVQRQPRLGHRGSQVHLRQGRLRLLAARKDGPPAVARAPPAGRARLAFMNAERGELPDEPPPFLGTWRRVYIAVLVYLAALISVFYLFTRAYS